MNLEELENKLNSICKQITELQDMVLDVKDCKCEKSQQILIAAINKLIQPYLNLPQA